MATMATTNYDWKLLGTTDAMYKQLLSSLSRTPFAKYTSNQSYLSEMAWP